MSAKLESTSRKFPQIRDQKIASSPRRKRLDSNDNSNPSSLWPQYFREIVALVRNGTYYSFLYLSGGRNDATSTIDPTITIKNPN